MTDFKTAGEEVINVFKTNAVGLGVPVGNIVVGEYGKSAKVKCPFIIIFPTVAKNKQHENNTYEGKENIGIVCGADGGTLWDNQVNSIKILGRILTLIGSNQIKTTFNIELIDTIALTSVTAVQLLALSTNIDLAEPLIVVEPS